ncbi:MAG: transposase [Rubrobacter sp.]
MELLSRVDIFESLPREVLKVWARRWLRERRTVDLEKLPGRQGFELPPRRWVAERTFVWISHNRRMSKDHERLCSAGEALVHAAMTRLMVKRLARARGFSDGLYAGL